MRNLKFRPIMKILGLIMMDDSNEKSIIKNLMSAYDKVGLNHAPKIVISQEEYSHRQ